jgi:DNA-binding response OmpR family regulator
MQLLIFARDLRLASGVKDWLDRRHVGLTCVVEIGDPARTVSAVTGLEPSVSVIVGRQIDPLVVELCRRLGLSAAVTPPRILIAVSEPVPDAEKIAALDAGADTVIQPVEPAVIERWISASRRRAGVGEAFHGKELSIEADGETVFVRGRRVMLTPREAAILRLLVHHRAGVLSRRTLEQSLWGAIRSRTLDVHIARLRKKLGPAGSQIQTVVKFGYRYVE